jgi:autotransporter family porin
VNAGGFHAAGNSIGTQTMLAGYTQNGTEQVELGTPGASPAAGLSDLTVVTGALNLGGSSTLQLIDNAGADGNGSMGAGAYRLITFTGTRTGTFNTVTNPLSATLHEKVVYGSGTVDLELYRLATANTITTPVNLGNVRVGGTFGTSALSIQNTAAATFSEGLNATQGSTTGSASVSGTDITNLAGGASSSTISVGLGGNANTGTAGAKTGTVTIGLASNGTNSGYANTSLTGQTITVNGAVYNPASAAASQTVTTLNTRVNASVSSSMSITNTGAASAPYQETLGTTGFSATSSGFTATGSATGVATSGSGSLTVGMDANAVAGAYSGSTTLGLRTEEVNSSGLGNLGIASQTVNINVNVYHFAQALLSQTGGAGTLTGLNLDFGDGLQLNTDYVATLQFANTAFGNAAFQDTLSGNYTGFTGTGFSTTAANFSGVAANSANSFTITFNTGSEGTFTGSINMTGNSDEAVAGLGSLALGMQTINFTATAIPEPNVAALLGSFGLIALLRRRR